MDVLDKNSATQSGQDGKITLEIVGDAAIVKMECGENRLNFLFFERMHQVLDEVERNPDVKYLITTAEGKYYSNGLDLQWLLNNLKLNEELKTKFRIQWNSFLIRFLTFPMPTIAAINGHAFAGGAILSLCHDYRIMRTQQGWWCLNEVNLQMFFSPFLQELFAKKIPVGHPLTEAVMLGRRFTAEEGLESGIIYATSPVHLLLDTAHNVAKKITPHNGFKRETFKLMKESIYKTAIDKKLDYNLTVKSKF